ncbi:hypothetical protein J6V85_04075 [Candidatus Saccharibacteria bacterium]|nr:hypothetical protein [Candidatus Saccharibacteria bacterium]
MVEKRIKPSEKKLKLPKNKKPFIIAIIIAAGILLIVLTIIICLITKNRSSEESANNKTEVDYSQHVTNKDGSEFNANYNTSSNENLSIRFTDLKCNDDCSNIKNLKIGDQTLEADKDYKVEQGSVIITIYKKFLQAISSGQYSIIFDIENGDQTITVGISITITNKSAQTNEEDQNEEEKQEEKPEENSQNNDSSQNSSSSSQNPTEPQPETEKTCSDLKNCDYNLNDRYVIVTDTFNFYSLPEGVGSVCDLNEDGNTYLDVSPIQTTITFYQIGYYTGSGGSNVPYLDPARTDPTHVQASRFAEAYNYTYYHDGWGCGGMGDIMRDWTWQEVIDKGYALDETKCATWNLSCGRW